MKTVLLPLCRVELDHAQRRHAKHHRLAQKRRKRKKNNNHLKSNERVVRHSNDTTRKMGFAPQGKRVSVTTQIGRKLDENFTEGNLD